MKRSFGALALFLLVVGLVVPPALAGHGHYRSHGGLHHGYQHGYQHGYYRPYYPSHYSWGVHYGGWPHFSFGYSYPTQAYVVEPAGYSRYRPSSSAVETDVRPKRAQVTLDGRPVGEARDFNGPWDLLVLRPGVHTLEFSAPGYMTLRIEVDAERGGYYHVRESLLEGSGMDPRSSEASPAAVAEVAESDKSRSGRLTAGRLHLQVEPPDAAVYLDGEFLAQAGELVRLHGALSVAVGEHTLEVTRPGYVDETHLLVVERDEPARIRIKLDRAE